MPRRKSKTPDSLTKRWIRNASDELAVSKGCWFDEARGAFVVEWIQGYCRLYEGEQAGEPMELRDWQQEVSMRLFGWQVHSERWGRPVRRFKQASVWIAKKNKKSPTLAAWGLYLLCGDGEMGQKVFLAAKDGLQAREIAGKHAIEMLMQSEELSSECVINKSTLQITHLKTRSLMKPLSSSNARTQQSKEGLNGSVLIDETHVVDREFAGRISRAGISRSEPLQIEVSTAGDNPDGYGKERYDYAVEVEQGKREDQELLAVIYAAPQELSDKDLAEDPLKYGRMANPAFGHTVDEKEFLGDYQRSKGNLTEFGRFKMYRLDIWQQSEHPWLDMGDWARCKRDYTEADLLGRECYAALDLAKTRDTCALALNFPCEDGTHKQLVYFWAPRKRAEALRDKVCYLKWAEDGHLVLTEGDTTDYAFIRQALIDLKNRFNIRKLAYDDCYAEQLIQRLIEEDGAFNVEEVCSFSQTIKEFAGPTDSYEALVIEGKLHHPGNALFTWQAGNTKVKVDVNHNKRPVKQKHGDHRTIDGIVAGIMALAVVEPVVNNCSIDFF